MINCCRSDDTWQWSENDLTMTMISWSTVVGLITADNEVTMIWPWQWLHGWSLSELDNEMIMKDHCHFMVNKHHGQAEGQVYCWSQSDHNQLWLTIISWSSVQQGKVLYRYIITQNFNLVSQVLLTAWMIFMKIVLWPWKIDQGHSCAASTKFLYQYTITQKFQLSKSKPSGVILPNWFSKMYAYDLEKNVKVTHLKSQPSFYIVTQPHKMSTS